jgi:lambda family phage portal protein
VAVTPRPLLLARAFTSAGNSLHRAAAYFRGAQHDQWNGDWRVGQVSTNQILRADLTTLVDRSRDLVMNNTTAARMPTLFSENISGKDGILYQAAVKFANGSYDKRTNTALENAWYKWAEDPRAVSADQRMSWYDIETLLDETEVVDGESFLRKLPNFENPFRFALQVLDSDQIDRGLNQEAEGGRNAIVMGVEVNAWGAAIAYHVWPNHPSELRRRGERMRIPADQILHQFITRRAGQVRGAPWLAAAIVELMQLGEYTEAEVKAARVSAAKMGFLQTSDEALQLTPSEKESYLKKVRWDAEPGSIEQLLPGQEFKEWNPLHPNGNYDAFEKAIVRRIATSARVSYMSLSGDLTQTSYASGRLGFLAERMVYQMLQQRKIARVHRPVHGAWLRSSLLAGQIDVQSFDAERMSAAAWRPRSYPGIDPAKEIAADDHKVAMGLTSLTRLAANEGIDFEEVMQERAREIELAAQYKVPLSLESAEKAKAEPNAQPAPRPGVAALSLVEDVA